MVKLLGRKTTVLVAVFSVWLLLLSSSSLALGAQTRGGTTPGEELLAVGGTLTNGQSTLPYQVFHTGVVNFELTVAGGASGNALTLTVTQNGTPTTWTARSGERFWGTVDLTTTANSWVVSNTSGVQLSYSLRVYTEGQVPVVADGGTTWSGTAVGGANASTIRLTFPTSGLYDFAFSVGGRYQFTLDTDYLQQTVEGNETVRAYVASGTHTLSIVQDPAVISTIWSVSVAAVSGAPGDTLPYTQSDGELGGAADAFDEIWFPLSVAAAGDVNLQIDVTGAADDLVTVELYNSATGNTPVVTGVEAYGGETVWLPASLVAGVNRLHVTTDAGNAGDISVTLTVHAVPSTPYTWSGESSGDNARNSQILLDVPTSGLYDFTFTVGSGRYQFALNDEYLQTSVEAGGSVTAYVPAGRHTLTVRQDPTVALTAWSVAIADGGAPTDTLPYQQVSGEIGGVGNAFAEDWWPLSLAAAAQANVRVTVLGDAADSLTVEVIGAAALNQPPATVYGGETRWLTVDLTAGTNRLHFVGNNTGSPLMYQVDVFALEETPTDWAGVALDDGGDSYVRFIAPSAGTYNIEFTFSEGAILPVVDPAAPVAPLVEPIAGEAGTVRVRVPLSAGVHTLQLVHDRNLPRTVWSGSVSLYTPQQGGDLLSVSGTLAPDQSTLAYQVFHTGIVNFELTVDGGTPADSLTLSVGQGGTPQTWTAQSGERFWGTIDLSTTANSWVVSNPTGGGPLDFTLRVYAQGTVPVVADGGTTWSGIAAGGASASTIQLNFPTSGLYTFSFTVGAGGRYQFLLDNDYLQQTVEANEAVEAYVAAGTHTLTIWQDPAVASTEWGVSMSAIPNMPADTLPYAQTDGQLGGTGDAFDEAWFPLAYTDTISVNVTVEVAGAATDQVLMELYNSAGTTPEWTVTAYGGETVWIPASLVALSGGVNRLHFSATGNTGAVNVVTTVHDVPTTPYAWVGDARGNGVHSQILLDVPTSGLYEFDFGVQSGRFQFALNDAYFQTSVEQSGPVTVYVPAGRHTLTVRQDSAVALTEWAVAISSAGATWDTLPYTQISGEIGGSANDFAEDWWPLALEEAAQANVRVTVTGNPSDSLSLDILGAGALAQGADVIYGGETRWVTVDLTAGTNRLHFVGNDTGSPLTYQVDVYALEMVPTDWAGVALQDGGDSYVRFIAPVNGTYDIEFNFSEGAILPVVDPAAPLSPIQASDDLSGTIRIRVPLTTGVHTLQLVHDRNLPRTVWDGNVTLRSPAEDLALTAIDPDLGLVGEPLNVTLTGTGFELGAQVTFISTVDGSTRQGTTLSVSNDGTTMEVLVPGTLVVGSHDVRVDNPASGQTTTLPASLTLVQPFAITSVDPATIPQGVETLITITGSFFTAGMTAYLEDSGGAQTPVTVEFVSATTLRITAPATLALGNYDLILERAQPAQSERIEDALTVINVSFPVYLPLLSRAP